MVYDNSDFISGLFIISINFDAVLILQFNDIAV